MSEITLNSPFPFGKYRGQPLQAALADADYMRWVMSQADMVDKHPALINFLANGPMKGAQDTEQHNRMQIRLLDKAVALRVLRAAFDKFAEASELEVTNVRFEVFNWDAVITSRVKFEGDDYASDFDVAVELKPTISEDYPAVLRQVTNRVQSDRLSRRSGLYSAVLVLTDRIHAKSATKDQLVQMFKANQIKLHEWAADVSAEFEDFEFTYPEVGDYVIHARFGSGKVVALEGTGDSARAQVDFADHGAKWLALSIAKLEIVDFLS